ncbi:7487_t:CDS:2 [Funneliformis geosporum]|uniref:7487_t:CDS:1 n=1 Tax=Funneliformis geosporum TaxID=1117311 RepID=A0A9W4WWT1_9GLOM|nr:7487_t:CDS:2 [Funneliformis geosporum]
MVQQFDGLECKKEWGMVKHVIKSVKKYDMIEGWHHIWNSQSQSINQFPNINILVKIALLVPLSNAIVERVFSQHKLTKTSLHFNWDKAFNQWEKEQVRRVNHN